MSDFRVLLILSELLYYFWPKIKDKTLQIVPHCVHYCLRVHYYFILNCDYELLYSIMANKQSQYIAIYFSMQELFRQLRLKYAMPERHDQFTR